MILRVFPGLKKKKKKGPYRHIKINRVLITAEDECKVYGTHYISHYYYVCLRFSITKS